MKLTSNQIQQLYKFTRQHYVEYYDVQNELVDHLANDIEQIWQEQPNLPFEDAKTISFKKFGVFGFMDVVEALAKALNKKYWKLVLEIFKEFFNIPKITISITIFLILIVGFQLLSSKIMFLSIGLGGLVVLLPKLYFLEKERKQRFKETNKKWLLEDYVFNIGGSLSIFNLFFQMVNFSPETASNTFVLIAAIILTVFMLLIYITIFIIPAKVEEILKNQYPEYKLV